MHNPYSTVHFAIVPCPPLADPNNGMISCVQRFMAYLSAGDTCTASCIADGYEVQSGDAIRTCGRDGMWSGNDAMCARGIAKKTVYLVCTKKFSVICPNLTAPTNGTITCSLGDDGKLLYEDTCSFTCNDGYIMRGSAMRICQSDGMWSGSETSCETGRYALSK